MTDIEAGKVVAPDLAKALEGKQLPSSKLSGDGSLQVCLFYKPAVNRNINFFLPISNCVIYDD